MTLKSLIIAGLVALAGPAAASTLLTEEFNYPNGNLGNNAGWTDRTLTGNFIQVTSGAAFIRHGGQRSSQSSIGFATGIGSLTAGGETVSGSSIGVQPKLSRFELRQSMQCAVHRGSGTRIRWRTW